MKLCVLSIPGILYEAAIVGYSGCGDRHIIVTLFEYGCCYSIEVLQYLDFVLAGIVIEYIPNTRPVYRDDILGYTPAA